MMVSDPVCLQSQHIDAFCSDGSWWKIGGSPRKSKMHVAGGGRGQNRQEQEPPPAGRSAKRGAKAIAESLRKQRFSFVWAVDIS